MLRFRMTPRALVLVGAVVIAASTWGTMSRQARESGVSMEPVASFGQARAETMALEGAVSHAPPTRANQTETYVVRGGHARFDFNRGALKGLNLWFVARGAIDEAGQGQRVSFNVTSSSTLRLAARAGVFSKIVGGRVHTSGALLLDRPGDRVVIGNLTIGTDDHGAYTVRSTLGQGENGFVAFDMRSVMVDFLPFTQELRILGGLSINKLWAEELEVPEAAGAEIGTLLIDGVAVPVDANDAGPSDTDEPAEEAVRTARSIGPDVVVADLQDVGYYGELDYIHAYSVATHACNYGDERADWVYNTNDHPVIAQNMYRLKDDRFEQVGMSWVKHGFYAVSWDFCELGCPDPTDGTQLGVGCSDPYDANLNGQQSNMSLRSDVNAHTGYFPYPWTAPPPPPVIGKRLQVHDEDLHPLSNSGAVYFVEAHYVNADDAAAGNADNNASYRPVDIDTDDPPLWPVTVAGETQPGQPGIRAWQDTDPTVVETDIRVPDEGLFILAAKATDLGTGTWRYSYALQNLNSDRSGRSFRVPVSGVTVTNPGFHDVDYHSGEIYDSTDWPAVIDADFITWSTESHDVNPNANALRYSTLYNFYFDCPVGPGPATVTLGLFKPGAPMEVEAPSIRPAPPVPPRPELGGPVCSVPSDCTGNWVGADCVAGSCYVPKNRYLSVKGQRNLEPVALRVELTEAEDYPTGVGRSWWVDEPVCYDYPNGNPVLPAPATCEGDDRFGWVAQLTSTAVAREWEEHPLNITGCGVVPAAVYEIRASYDGVALSDPLTIGTAPEPEGGSQTWGDVTGGPGSDGVWLPPEGVTNFADVANAIRTFENRSEDTGFPPRIWVDVEINQVINLADVQFIVGAFEGTGYAEINLPLIGVHPADCP